MINKNLESKIQEAYLRIKPFIYYTPIIKAHHLSKLLNADIYLKLENTQHTSSFKTRGAFNKLLSLPHQEKTKGVIAASSGNHGAAVAYACQKLCIHAQIFVPETTANSKLESIKLFGADIIIEGKDCGITEENAKKVANQKNIPFISPYNDIDIITGQGTIAYEILKSIPNIDVIYTSVGGGGLISGIAGYTKSVNKNIKVVGCLPMNSPVMYESIKAGKIVECENKHTLSDGTAGNIEEQSITFDFCKKYVDEFSLVNEKEIEESFKFLLFKEHILVEGAAAVSVAALIKNKEKIRGKKIAVIICGSNIDQHSIKEILVK